MLFLRKNQLAIAGAPGHADYRSSFVIAFHVGGGEDR
jgi:hypothetical protein